MAPAAAAAPRLALAEAAEHFPGQGHLKGRLRLAPPFALMSFHRGPLLPRPLHRSPSSHPGRAIRRVSTALSLTIVAVVATASSVVAQERQQQAPRRGGSDAKPSATVTANGSTARQEGGAKKATGMAKRAAPVRLTPRQRIEAEIRSAAGRVRAAMVVQDTTTLAELWGEDYIFTSLTGETYSKYERLEAVMSPTFLVDEAPEVLPSEMDIVRLYGNVAVVHSRLAPPGTARSGSRGGRAQLLTVWLRERGTWRTVAAQTTAVAPAPAPGKKK